MTVITGKAFIDTNVIVYAASRASDDAEKRDRARRLLASVEVVVSAQVLQEFYSAAVVKRRLRMSASDALAVVRTLERYAVCPVDSALVIAAIELQQRYRISYWDAAIVAAAVRMKCAVLYSEDLSAGQDYAGVTVMNPFAD